MGQADVSNAIKTALDEINLPDWDYADTYLPQQPGENFREFGQFIEDKLDGTVCCTIKVTFDSSKRFIQLPVIVREQGHNLLL